MNVNEYYTLILAQSVNKFHYGIYIYMECKSQTIYKHNISQDNIRPLTMTHPQTTLTYTILITYQTHTLVQHKHIS